MDSEAWERVRKSAASMRTVATAGAIMASFLADPQAVSVPAAFADIGNLLRQAHVEVGELLDLMLDQSVPGYTAKDSPIMAVILELLGAFSAFWVLVGSLHPAMPQEERIACWQQVRDSLLQGVEAARRGEELMRTAVPQAPDATVTG